MHSCFLFKLDALRTWPRPGCWWCLRSGHCEDLTQKNANGCSALKHLTWTSYRILFKRSTDTRHFEQCWGMPHTVRGPEQRGTHHSTYYMKATKPLRKIIFHTLKQRNQTKFRHWLELRKFTLEISLNHLLFIACTANIGMFTRLLEIMSVLLTQHFIYVYL